MSTEWTGCLGLFSASIGDTGPPGPPGEMGPPGDKGKSKQRLDM